MRFLALPLGQALLLIAATAAIVAALYLMRFRRRRLTVPSTLLWQRALAERRMRWRSPSLRRLLSLLLALTIALLAASAVGDPEIEALTGRARRVGIVLDSSPSMGALNGDGSTRWQRALEHAARLVSSRRQGDRFRVLTTSGVEGDVQRLDDLESVSLTPGRFPPIDFDYTELYFVSDGVSLAAIPPDAAWISVFEQAGNVGIRHFEVASAPRSPLEWEAYLEVFNQGERSLQCGVTIRGGERELRKELTLEPGESSRHRFDLSGFESGPVEARIEPEADRLAADNRALAYLPAPRRIRVQLVSGGNRYLEQALELDEQVDLRVIRPSDYSGDASADVLVFDRFAPAARPALPALLLDPPLLAWAQPGPAAAAATEVVSSNPSHPLMRYVPLEDLRIQQRVAAPAGPESVPPSVRNQLILAASGPPPWVRVGFDLEASGFQLQLGFPIFIRNAVTWLAGRERVIRAGTGLAEVPLPEARVTRDGQPVAVSHWLGKTLFEAEQSGLYLASRDGLRQAIVVNEHPSGDINTPRLQNPLQSDPPASSRLRPLWPLMLAAVFALALGEWWLYHGGITS